MGGLCARAGRVVHQRLREKEAWPMGTARVFQRRDIGTIGMAWHPDQAHVMRTQLLEQHEVARILDQHRVPGR